MGFFSKWLEAPKSEVKGHIALANRPQASQFSLRVVFFKTDAGAPPRWPDLPPEADLKAAVEAKALSKGITPGDEFVVELEAGHYQVAVIANALSKEGGTLTVLADQRACMWPFPKALEIEANRARRLDLRVSLPQSLLKTVKPTTAAPLFQRIGPALVAEFQKAVALANQDEHVQAMSAYDALAGSPAVDQLPSDDAQEFRLMLKLGKVKSLNQMKRYDDAWAAIEALGAPKELNAIAKDFRTRWDIHRITAQVVLRVDRFHKLPAAVEQAVVALLPALEEPGAKADQIEKVLLDFVMPCLAKARAERKFDAAMQTVMAVLEKAKGHRGISNFLMTMTVVRIDLTAELGNPQAGQALAKQLLSEAAQREQTVDRMREIATTYDLTNAFQILRVFL